MLACTTESNYPIQFFFRPKTLEIFWLDHCCKLSPKLSPTIATKKEERKKEEEGTSQYRQHLLLVLSILLLHPWTHTEMPSSSYSSSLLLLLLLLMSILLLCGILHIHIHVRLVVWVSKQWQPLTLVSKFRFKTPSCCRCYTTATDAADGVADDDVAAAVAVSPRKTLAILARLKAAAPSPPPPVSERVLLLLLFLGRVLSITTSWEAKRGNKWNGCSMYAQLPPYNNIPAVEVLAPLSRTLPPSSLPPYNPFLLLALPLKGSNTDWFPQCGQKKKNITSRTSPHGQWRIFLLLLFLLLLVLVLPCLLILLLFCFFVLWVCVGELAVQQS